MTADDVFFGGIVVIILAVTAGTTLRLAVRDVATRWRQRRDQR